MSYQFGSVEPDEHPGDYAEAAPRRRSLAALLLALMVMSACAGGLWVAYKLGAAHRGDSGEVPLLRADPGPTRIKPDNPGGMEIPDRNSAIFHDARPQAEHLLPPPETPLPRPAPPPPPPPAPAPQPAAAAAPALPASPAAPALPAEPAAPQPAAATPPPAPAAPEPAGIRLQFGAFRNQGAAEQEWQRLKRADADLLGKLDASVVRADLGDKGIFWRIESQSLADPIAGLELCEQLKSRNVGCVIAR